VDVCVRMSVSGSTRNRSRHCTQRRVQLHHRPETVAIRNVYINGFYLQEIKMIQIHYMYSAIVMMMLKMMMIIMTKMMMMMMVM
jgi:hypothetical protein